VDFDFVVVFIENAESVLGFGFTSINFSVFLFPVLPQVVDRGGDFLRSRDSVSVEEHVAGSEDSSNGEESDKYF